MEATCSMIMVGTRANEQNCLLIISQVRATAGVSIMRMLISRGYIDDLSTIDERLPKGEKSKCTAFPSHQSYHISLHHQIFVLNKQYNRVIMDQFISKPIDITPEYLLTLSRQIDVISKQYQLQKLGTLTQDFSNTLTTLFSQLSQFLNLYQEDAIMKSCCVLKCKANLEIYTLQKSVELIKRQNSELGSALERSSSQLKQFLGSFESLILSQRQAQNSFIDREKDKIIFGLRRQVGIKRQYTSELEERIHQLEDQNSKLYSKLITNAKNTSNFAIHSSPAKIKQLLTTGPLPLSERPKSPRKKVTSRSYEEEVLEILETKARQESIQQKYTSLDGYLKIYFTMKYGKPLAEQNQYSFRQAIGLLARGQEKHIFLLFQAILEENCQQSYFNQYKLIYERITKCIKRYLNERYNRPLYELDKLFDSKNIDQKNDFPLSQADLQPILANVYKSAEVNTLQMVLSEILTSRTSNGKIYCKKLINQILNYQLNKHLMRVEDIVRQSFRISEGQKTLTFTDVKRVMVKLIKDQNRYELLHKYQDQWRQKRFTISQVIDIIQKIRKVKYPKKEDKY